MNELDIQAVSLLDKIVFAVLAGATLGGALFTITRRNPVTAVMSLVGTFFALAGLYATLAAHFLAVLQVLVYAGAIMVLFIFVVMILNREEVEPVSFRGIVIRAAGVAFGGYLTLLMARLVWNARAMAPLSGGMNPPTADFGTVGAAGLSLFRDFVFPFEAISILLLVAIVGGIVVSRSHRQEESAEAMARHQKETQAAIRPETRLNPVTGAPLNELGEGQGDPGAAHAHH